MGKEDYHLILNILGVEFHKFPPDIILIFRFIILFLNKRDLDRCSKSLFCLKTDGNKMIFELKRSKNLKSESEEFKMACVRKKGDLYYYRFKVRDGEKYRYIEREGNFKTKSEALRAGEKAEAEWYTQFNIFKPREVLYRTLLNEYQVNFCIRNNFAYQKFLFLIFLQL